MTNLTIVENKHNFTYGGVKFNRFRQVTNSFTHSILEFNVDGALTEDSYVEGYPDISKFNGIIEAYQLELIFIDGKLASPILSMFTDIYTMIIQPIEHRLKFKLNESNLIDPDDTESIREFRRFIMTLEEVLGMGASWLSYGYTSDLNEHLAKYAHDYIKVLWLIHNVQVRAGKRPFDPDCCPVGISGWHMGSDWDIKDVKWSHIIDIDKYESTVPFTLDHNIVSMQGGDNVVHQLKDLALGERFIAKYAQVEDEDYFNYTTSELGDITMQDISTGSIVWVVGANQTTYYIKLDQWLYPLGYSKHKGTLSS